MISVVTVLFQSAGELPAYLAALGAALSTSDEIILVDNASTDGGPEWVEHHAPEVRLLRLERNVGFGAGCNAGIRAAHGDRILLLNPDARVEPDAIRVLARELDAHPRAGAAAALIVDETGCPLPSHEPFPTPWSIVTGGHPWPHVRPLPPPKRPVRVDWPYAACLLLRREALEQAGLFDERVFLFAEEPDLAARLRASGWERWLVPAARVTHPGGVSTARTPRRSQADWYCFAWHRFYERHYDRGRRRLCRLAEWVCAVAKLGGYALAAQVAPAAPRPRLRRRMLWYHGVLTWHVHAWLGDLRGGQTGVVEPASEQRKAGAA